jgi:hypothetical protein
MCSRPVLDTAQRSWSAGPGSGFDAFATHHLPHQALVVDWPKFLARSPLCQTAGLCRSVMQDLRRRVLQPSRATPPTAVAAPRRSGPGPRASSGQWTSRRAVGSGAYPVAPSSDRPGLPGSGRRSTAASTAAAAACRRPAPTRLGEHRGAHRYTRVSSSAPAACSFRGRGSIAAATHSAYAVAAPPRPWQRLLADPGQEEGGGRS